MPTPVVKLVFKKKYAADTHGYIKLRVPVPDGKPIEKSLKYKIPQSGWDRKAQHVKPSAASRDVDPAQINAEIIKAKADLLSELQQRTLADKIISPTVIKSAMRHGKSSNQVLPFMDTVIADMKVARKTKFGDKPKYSPGYTKMLDTLKNKIEAYADDLTFEDINTEWMERFEKHLALTLNSETTLPKTLNRMHLFLDKAERRGLFSFVQIAGFEAPGYVNPDREYLTLAETDKIGKHLYDGKFKGEVRTIAAFFLVECYAGIRFSDWSRFSVEKLIHNDALFIRKTQKTKEPIYLPLNKSPRLAKVIKYIADNNLTFTLTEQYTNRVLGDIAEELEIKKHVTSHCGRHTCASLLLELGYSKEAAAAVLGVSMATIDIYAKVTRRKLSAEYEKYGGL